MLQLSTWLSTQGGIAHRQAALRAGVPAGMLRSEVARGAVRCIRRNWLVLPESAGDPVQAATVGGRVACISVARARRWWLPEDLDQRLHVSIPPHGRSDAARQFAGVVHWSRPIAPTDAFSLSESVEDALDHIAACLPPEHAQVIWDSAARRERLDGAALRSISWSTAAAVRCAERVSGLADSGLETVFVFRFEPWGIPFRQQVVIAARPVDILIGDRLVVQIDGYAHHSTSADRTRDAAHDAELMLRGYTVLRFTYAQILHDWPAVARTLSRAIAAGAHLIR